MQVSAYLPNTGLVNHVWPMSTNKPQANAKPAVTNSEVFISALCRYIQHYTCITLNPEERSLIAQSFRYRAISRKQYLLQQGDSCRYFTFVLSGALRMFSINDRGNEAIISFATEHTWAADWESIILQQPSCYNIDAIERSQVLQITTTQLYKLSLTIPAIAEMMRRQRAENVIDMQKRIYAAISLTAEERYLDMMRSKPQYQQRFPQVMIASYLGIKAETLSRLIKRCATHQLNTNIDRPATYCRKSRSFGVLLKAS